MPRLRLLADGSLANASEAAGGDADGNPMFAVGAADTVLIRLDATGYTQGETITLSEWYAANGAIVDGEAQTGDVVSALATIPDAMSGSIFTVRNTLTLADGRMRNTTMLLRVQAR